MDGRLPADDVESPLPELGPLGGRGQSHPLGRGPGLVGAGPLSHGHRQPMDTHQLPGQQFSAVISALIAQTHGPRQQGHQQGGVIAVLRRRIHRRERGRGHVRVTEQAQDGRLTGQQALRVPNEERLDEGPQDE